MDDHWIMGIEGKNKNDYQVRAEKDSFLILDDLQVDFAKKNPSFPFLFYILN